MIDKISNNPNLLKPSGTTNSGNKGISSKFADMIKGGIDNFNTLQVQGQKAMIDIATGQVKDLHEAALAIDKAEASLKLALEIKNKALNAYKEVSRTQI